MNVKQYKHRVQELGCLICGGPANLHHPRFCCGMSQRASDYLVVPICKFHHQDGPYGQAIHNGQAEFEKNFMSEQEMLAETIKRMVK